MKTYASILLCIFSLTFNPTPDTTHGKNMYKTTLSQDDGAPNSRGNQVVASVPFTFEDRIIIPVRVKESRELKMIFANSHPDPNFLPGCEGILGIQVLKQFNLIFDYFNEIIYLRSNCSFSELPTCIDILKSVTCLLISTSCMNNPG